MFASEMRNLTRTAALLNAIVEMYGSQKWRRYETSLGQEEWRECEFDYFLMACDAEYEDISRVLAWNREGKALAAAMAGDDPAKRRSLEQASATWTSATGESLAERAARQGWLNSRGVLRPPPVPERARAKVRHGITMDEHARRRREEQIAPKRRRELESRVAEMARELTELELRFVRDIISSKVTKAKSRAKRRV
jgi:hypothetical protein